MTIKYAANVWETWSKNSCIIAVLAVGRTREVIFPSAGATAA
jgi:hypothetical protein